MTKLEIEVKGGASIEIFGKDADNEIRIIVYDDVSQDVYLSEFQVREIIKFLQKIVD